MAPVRADGRPLAIEDYIRYVVTRYQASHGEAELAELLGLGRKALWVRRRRWELLREPGSDVPR